MKKYDPRKTDHKVYVKKRHSKRQGMRMVKNREIEDYITEKMRLNWPIEAIAAGRLPIDGGDKVVSIHLQNPNSALISSRKKQFL